MNFESSFKAMVRWANTIPEKEISPAVYEQCFQLTL